MFLIQRLSNKYHAAVVPRIVAWHQINQWEKIIHETFRPYKEFNNPTPEISTNGAVLPKTIILVIGESETRTHMSAYGYTKPTTPWLDRLATTANTVLFTDVQSPAPSTNMAFEHFMTTDRSTMHAKEGKEFSDCFTVTGLIHEMGYKQFWLSSQNNGIIHSSIQNNLAHLCDSAKFIRKDKKVFDGELLPHFRGYVTSTNDSLNFIYVHINGSHVDYSERYPRSFARFNPSDYNAISNASKAKQISEYDNSVAYTDWFLSEIAKAIEPTEALMIYFPDHGNDVYQSRTDYCGHGISYDAASYEAGTQIPFFLYATDFLLSKHPDFLDKARQVKDNYFNTTDFPALLLDILNVELTSEPAYVSNRSPLRQNGKK